MRRFKLAGRVCKSGHFVGGEPSPGLRRSFRRASVAAVTLAGLLLASPSSSLAILISSGSGNPTSATIPGLSSSVSNQVLDSVGVAGIGSADYIGNGYVITARHVTNPGLVSVNFGGTTYNPVAGSAQFFGSADIIAYQVLSATGQRPNVTPLQVSAAAPTVGETVSAIGYGVGASGGEVYYTRSGDTFSSSNSVSGTYGGYHLDSAAGVTERWGQGTLADATPFGGSGAIGTVTVNSFTSTDVFSQYYTSLSNERAQVALGNTNEFLVTGGDSGGALVDSSGRLVGILQVMFTYADSNGNNIQPSGTGLFGDASGAVSLANYAAQINAFAVPEPTSLMLMAIGFGGVAWRLRRQRARGADSTKVRDPGGI